jgi:hypothetical protein
MGAGRHGRPMPGSQASQFRSLYRQLIFTKRCMKFFYTVCYRCCAQQTAPARNRLVYVVCWSALDAVIWALVISDVRRSYLQVHELGTVTRPTTWKP